MENIQKDYVNCYSFYKVAAESIDTGKLIGDCINEVANDAPMHFQWYGELIDKVFGKTSSTDPSITSLIVKEPIGVVAGIVPWNFPLMMAVWKMAPALAAGCSIIIKPAEDTPLTAIKVAKIAQDAGVPDGVLNILPGYELGEIMALNPEVMAQLTKDRVNDFVTLANKDFSSLANKYGLLCKNLVENPEQRTIYWQKKGNKKFK